MVYKDRIAKRDCELLIKSLNEKYKKDYSGEFKHIELLRLESRERLISIIGIHGESHIKFADLFGVYHHLENLDKDVKELFDEGDLNKNVTFYPQQKLN